MRIPASRFSTLPEGCPVLWGDTPATILGRHGATEYRIRVEGRIPTTTAAGESQLRVALDSPAAIRAFAPALIAQLVAVGRVGIVAAVPDDLGQYHLCIVYGMNDGGLHIRGDRAVRGLDVVEPTPEACLLSGLKAALVAACVAVGGAS